MAKHKPSYILRPGMTTAQFVTGFCYLPFYLALLSLGLQWLFTKLGIPLTSFQLNALYFTINFVVIALVYHRFLWYSLRQTGFWSYLQTLILALVFYYALMLVLNWIATYLFPDFSNPNNSAIDALAAGHRIPMLLFSVVFAPIIEEILVRGVVFGAFHRKSRIAAYAASIFLFSFMHVWGYWGTVDLKMLLLSAVQYIPASAALGWAYEKSGSIWTPITLHAVINAVTFGLIQI